MNAEAAAADLSRKSINQYPRFVTLEGVEGAGKSTAIAAIKAALEAEGREVVVTREPGGTPMAETIRECLLSKRDEAVTNEAELLMMFAARAQHVQGLILPALQRGAWVICDRFTDSSYAYQGFGRGMNIELIRMLEVQVVGIAPSLTLFLDVPVDVGLQRARARGGDGDRIEAEREAFFEQVREGFMSRAYEHPDRYRVINSAQSLEAMSRDIEKAVAAWSRDGQALGPQPERRFA